MGTYEAQLELASTIGADEGGGQRPKSGRDPIVSLRIRSLAVNDVAATRDMFTRSWVKSYFLVFAGDLHHLCHGECPTGHANSRHFAHDLIPHPMGFPTLGLSKEYVRYIRQEVA